MHSKNQNQRQACVHTASWFTQGGPNAALGLGGGACWCQLVPAGASQCQPVPAGASCASCPLAPLRSWRSIARIVAPGSQSMQILKRSRPRYLPYMVGTVRCYKPVDKNMLFLLIFQGHSAYHSFCDRTLLTFGCRLGSQGGPGRASWGSCALECSVYSSQQTAVCCV